MRTAESRDFNVATYSVVSFTATERAVSTLTGIAGGPFGPAALGSFPPQATVKLVAAISPAHSKVTGMGRSLSAEGCSEIIRFLSILVRHQKLSRIQAGPPVFLT